MDGAKKLTGLELDNYQYPLADVSHLSEEEKKELFINESGLFSRRNSSTE